MPMGIGQTRDWYAPPELRVITSKIECGFALSDAGNLESLGGLKGEIGWGADASDFDNLESIGGSSGEINW